MKKSRLMVVFGSLLLFATAMFHSTGIRDVSRAVADTDWPQWLSQGYKAVWLSMSAHWVILGVLAVTLTWRSAAVGRLALGFCISLLAVDIGLMLTFVGPFLGELMLAAVILAYGIAMVGLRSESQQQNAS